MPDNTEKLPEERVGDLEPKHVTEENADAVRGGFGVTEELGELSQAFSTAINTIGNAMQKAVRQA